MHVYYKKNSLDKTISKILDFVLYLFAFLIFLVHKYVEIFPRKSFYLWNEEMLYYRLILQFCEVLVIPFAHSFILSVVLV